MSDGDLWRDRNKVFVAGLPAHVDDSALYAKFKTFGEMHQSKVVYDNKTGRSKGFGFVTFCEYVHALEAVDNLNQSVRLVLAIATHNTLLCSYTHTHTRCSALCTACL